jgi:hypothetical protein
MAYLKMRLFFLFLNQWDNMIFRKINDLDQVLKELMHTIQCQVYVNRQYLKLVYANLKFKEC